MLPPDSVLTSGASADHALDPWLNSPPGRYWLAWEQAQMDRVVSDLFGFHAMQFGLPSLRALQANRMPHRWLAVDESRSVATLHAIGHDHPPPEAVAPFDLRCHFDALPLPSRSLDLAVLPHTLETVLHPHETLREIERVLMPEGRMVITGFNRASLWGLKQRTRRWRRRLGSDAPLFLPEAGEFIGYRRLRDWLKLLGMDVEGGRFGCYAPAVQSQIWLDRTAWMDKTGDRWWPVFGAAYLLVAVKRTRGVRVVGLPKKAYAAQSRAPAVATRRATSQDSLNRDTP
jgi:SAM-dependent methyltransferase